MIGSSFWFALTPVFNRVDQTLCVAQSLLELRGISWFGFEGVGAIVDGLWEHPLSYYVELCRQLGINALRIPLAVDNILINPAPATSTWRTR